MQLIQDHFIAAAVPTWVVRSKGPEGEFLRAAGINWITSTGYISGVSASGKGLGNATSPAKMLAVFHNLPEAERKPGAVRVPDLKPEEKTLPSPPPGGLILKVHGRLLSRDGNNPLRYAAIKDFPLVPPDNPSLVSQAARFTEASPDFVWLTQEEWRALVPANLKKGDKVPVPAAISQRLCRFHLVPRRLAGEGAGWGRKAVRAVEITLTTTEITPSLVRLRLEGSAHIGTDFDPAKATTPNGGLAMGYQADLAGWLEYDASRKAFTRFDVIALGDVWGTWPDANGKSQVIERPGRNPMAFTFELADSASSHNRFPPGGNALYLQPVYGYFAK